MIILNIFSIYLTFLQLNSGASYHRSSGTRKMLERLQVPLSMLGPYGYQQSVAELFFAAFKTKDINPSKVPSGKTHFKEVVKLVV